MTASFRWILFGCALSLATSVAAQERQSTDAEHEEREGRIRILANGLYQPTGTTFAESTTFTEFVEEGRSSRSYDGGKGFVFEVGAIVRLTESLGVMGSVEVYQSDFDATFEETLPHPLYFGQSRTVTGTSSGLSYSEKAIHVDAVFTRVLPSVTVDVFGGPTFFVTSTEILNTINTSSEYPFDEVVLNGTSSVTVDDNPIGFNAGGSVTFHVTKVFGIAVQGRYSHATVTVSRGGQDIDLDAGGFRIGAGIRLAF